VHADTVRANIGAITVQPIIADYFKRILICLAVAVVVLPVAYLVGPRINSIVIIVAVVSAAGNAVITVLVDIAIAGTAHTCHTSYSYKTSVAACTAVVLVVRNMGLAPVGIIFVAIIIVPVAFAHDAYAVNAARCGVGEFAYVSAFSAVFVVDIKVHALGPAPGQALRAIGIAVAAF
jgi:hypothetical protein